MQILNALLVGLVLVPSLGCNLFNAVGETGSDPVSGADLGSDAGIDVSWDISVDSEPDLIVTLDAGSDLGRSVELCGNDQIDDDEACDVSRLPASCLELGFGGGSLSCDPNCEYDTSACFGCNIYIDDAGDDSLDGTSAQTAWASLGRIEEVLDSETSQTVCLRRGAAFETKKILQINWSGNRTKKLTLRSYGDPMDPPPIVHGGVKLELTLVDPAENIWEAPLPFTEVDLLVDASGVYTRDTVDPLGESRWQHDGSVLSFHLPDGQVPQDVYATHGPVIGVLSENEATRFVDIRELQIKNSPIGIGIVASGGDVTNINIDRVIFERLATAVTVSGTAGRNINLLTVADNEFSAIQTGIRLSVPSGVDRTIIVERNTFEDFFPRAGFSTKGVELYNHSGVDIRDNVVLGRGRQTNGTGIYLLPFGSGKYITIERNFVQGWGNGMATHMLGTPGTLRVVNNIVVDCQVGISAGLGGSATETIAHNTLQNLGTGIVTYGGGVSLQNNIFADVNTALRISSLTQLEFSEQNLYAGPTVFAWAQESGPFTEWRRRGFDRLSLESAAAKFVGGPVRDSASYQLAPASLAVDAGGKTSVKDDFGLRERDELPDIGAWELK